MHKNEYKNDIPEESIFHEAYFAIVFKCKV